MLSDSRDSCFHGFSLFRDEEKRKKNTVGENRLALFISFLEFVVDSSQSSISAS